MHVHMQLFRDGQPIFYDENGYGQLSDTALWFIGGLLKHAASLCAITNPSTNSYKRLVPGFEAPVTVGYAMAANRDPSVPCHRVVDRFGGTKACFDTHSPGTQRALLEAEGVLFRLDGTVDLERCQWEPSVSVL